MGFLQTPNKHLASLLEFNTYWWMMAADKCMMNCTFRLKWEIDIISNTWRSFWWSKHLTLLLISNDKHFPSVPHNSLLKELNVVVDSGPPAPSNTYFIQILLLRDRPVDISEPDNVTIPLFIKKINLMKVCWGPRHWSEVCVITVFTSAKEYMWQPAFVFLTVPK